MQVVIRFMVNRKNVGYLLCIKPPINNSGNSGKLFVNLTENQGQKLKIKVQRPRVEAERQRIEVQGSKIKVERRSRLRWRD